MKSRIHAILGMALSLTCFTTGAFATNIVVNGNFEGSTYASYGDIIPTGWILGPPSDSSQSKANVSNAVNAGIDQGPQSGSDYMMFQSPSTSGRDCLLQDLNTIAGQMYNISFWVATTSTSAGNNVGLDVEWDENTANQTSLPESYDSPTNTGPVAYQEFTFTEMASTNLTRLDFHGIDTNGAILLDNVSVSQVSTAPEPRSILLGGTGLLLAGLARRRRS